MSEPDAPIPPRHARLIAQFQARSFATKYRAWNMGQTILVSADLDDSSEIKVYKRWIYLIPASDQHWITFINSENPTHIHEDQIVDHISDILATQESFHNEIKKSARLAYIHNPSTYPIKRGQIIHAITPTEYRIRLHDHSETQAILPKAIIKKVGCLFGPLPQQTQVTISLYEPPRKNLIIDFQLPDNPQSSE